MGYEWDEKKNQTNIKKHGIGFETASKIFDGPVLTWLDVRKDYGESRWISIGRVGGQLIVAVAYTDRNNNIRLISARVASKNERRRFENAERKNTL